MYGEQRKQSKQVENNLMDVVSSVVEHLPSRPHALGSILSTTDNKNNFKLYSFKMNSLIT
jgi:hypothetical protein